MTDYDPGIMDRFISRWYCEDVAREINTPEGRRMLAGTIAYQSFELRWTVARLMRLDRSVRWLARVIALVR